MAGKHHDLVNFTKKYKAALYGFFLDLKHWKKFRTRYKLEWKKVRFDRNNHDSVPEERGIYAFTVELSPGKLPAHGYILYIGITGDTSDANLHKRYAQYLLHQKNQDGRPAVYNMLETWSGDLFFNFVCLPDMNVDLATLELSILSAIAPPVNKRDLGAAITTAKAATF